MALCKFLRKISKDFDGFVSQPLLIRLVRPWGLGFVRNVRLLDERFDSVVWRISNVFACNNNVSLILLPSIYKTQTYPVNHIFICGRLARGYRRNHFAFFVNFYNCLKTVYFDTLITLDRRMVVVVLYELYWPNMTSHVWLVCVFEIVITWLRRATMTAKFLLRMLAIQIFTLRNI